MDCADHRLTSGWEVFAGLAQFTGLDAWLWRLAFTLMLIVGGTGFLVYLLLWILVPPDTAR